MQDDHLPSTLLGWLWFWFREAVFGICRLFLSGFRWMAGTTPVRFVSRNVKKLANLFRKEGRLISLFTRRAWFHVGLRFRNTVNAVRNGTRAAFSFATNLMRWDRRTLCWTAASVTGGLALLLMLSWQAFAIIDQVSAGDSDHLVTTFRGKEQQQLNAELADASSESPDIEKSPSVITVTNARQAEPPPQTVEKTNSVDEYGLPRNIGKKPPFGEEPAVKTVNSQPEDRNPFEEKTAPALPDPFGAPEPPGMETPAPKSENPFASPPKAIVETPPKQLTPIKTVSVESASPGELTLEIVRTPVSSEKTDDSDRFLVTSLSSLLDLKTDGDDYPDAFGWTAVRWAPRGTGILPTRYVQSTVSERETSSAMNTVNFSSTATTHWQVGTAKLQYDIVLPSKTRVGERVPIQLRVTNIGPATAEKVALLIDLPDALAYSVGKKLTHTVGSLNPGETRVARLTPVAMRAGDVVISGKAVAANTSQPVRKSLRIEMATQTGRASRLRQRAANSQPCCIGGR